jgi:hypothetical protein
MNSNTLKHKWNIWFHSITDKNWGINSYELLYTIETYYDLYFVDKILNNDIYTKGMFFFMKEGILPTWEDPNNIKGGCISYKINYNNIHNDLNFILINTLINNFYMEDTLNENINGISISPKKTFNICKIWLKEDLKGKNKFLEKKPNIIAKNSIYKNNK